MGMDYYALKGTEVSKEYARTFPEMVELESYIEPLDCDMQDVADFLDGNDSLDDLLEVNKATIEYLWGKFESAFRDKHPHAKLFLGCAGNDIEGADAPEDGWYIGVSNYLIKNPALEDLDDKLNQLSWVTWG